MWPARLVARLPRVPRFTGASSSLVVAHLEEHDAASDGLRLDEDTGVRADPLVRGDGSGGGACGASWRGARVRARGRAAVDTRASHA